MNIESLLTEGMIWAYRCVITQTHADPQNVGIKITPGTGRRVIFYEVTVGTDDYAAARTLVVRQYDEDSQLIGYYGNGSMDNQVLKGLIQASEADGSTTVNMVGTTLPFVIVTNTDYLLIQGTSLAQNETITINLRAFVHRTVPTIAEVRGDQTTTETYNKTF